LSTAGADDNHNNAQAKTSADAIPPAFPSHCAKHENKSDAGYPQIGRIAGGRIPA
jgi:hypothetical protein